MNYEGFLELVKRRRSIRRFKPDPLPDELVEKIIEAARWAPSGANSQPWEFLVIKKPETREKIVQLLKEHGAVSRSMELTREEAMRVPNIVNPPERASYADAPAFILLCGDPRTQKAYPATAYYQRGPLIFCSSQASAFLYMHLAAASLGLGSQWVSAVANPATQCLLKEGLGIPEEMEIYDMMAVGYPAHQPRARFVRERREMVHYDNYNKDKFRTPEQVRNFIISLRQERGPRE